MLQICTEKIKIRYSYLSLDKRYFKIFVLTATPPHQSVISRSFQLFFPGLSLVDRHLNCPAGNQWIPKTNSSSSLFKNTEMKSSLLRKQPWHLSVQTDFTMTKIPRVEKKCQRNFILGLCFNYISHHCPHYLVSKNLISFFFSDSFLDNSIED